MESKQFKHVNEISNYAHTLINILIRKNMFSITLDKAVYSLYVTFSVFFYVLCYAIYKLNGV